MATVSEVTQALMDVLTAALPEIDASDLNSYCLLYTSDAADERSRVDLGGRRIIKKKNELHRGYN